jgi:hypothetical protein
MNPKMHIPDVRIKLRDGTIVLDDNCKLDTSEERQRAHSKLYQRLIDIVSACPVFQNWLVGRRIETWSLFYITDKSSYTSVYPTSFTKDQASDLLSFVGGTLGCRVTGFEDVEHVLHKIAGLSSHVGSCPHTTPHLVDALYQNNLVLIVTIDGNRITRLRSIYRGYTSGMVYKRKCQIIRSFDNDVCHGLSRCEHMMGYYYDSLKQGKWFINCRKNLRILWFLDGIHVGTESNLHLLISTKWNSFKSTNLVPKDILRIIFLYSFWLPTNYQLDT